MKIDILTLFPGMFDGFLNNSIIKIMDIKVNKFRPNHNNISKNNRYFYQI